MEIKAKSIINFDTLFEEYNSYVFKIVINESKGILSKEDIEETVSDIFFLLWKNRKKVKDYSKIKSYIGAIAKNTTKNKLRKANKEVSFEENMIVTEKNSEESYYINEQLNLVHNALQEMDEDDRRLFLMYYYENKKIKEISESEDIKASAIKTKLHRIRKKLKKLLEKGGFKNE